jgi:hypothetical protein
MKHGDYIIIICFDPWTVELGNYDFDRLQQQLTEALLYYSGEAS